MIYARLILSYKLTLHDRNQVLTVMRFSLFGGGYEIIYEKKAAMCGAPGKKRMTNGRLSKSLKTEIVE